MSGTYSKKKKKRTVHRLNRYDEAIKAAELIILNGDQELIEQLKEAILEAENN